MKLSPETLARKRPQTQPVIEYQHELPNMPPPMTVRQSKDYGYNMDTPDPLGR